MFESILADILNRYLKPYVKKLDTSQLRLGIWKGKKYHAPPRPHIVCTVRLLMLTGDVCLENLELKDDIFVCTECSKNVVLCNGNPDTLFTVD